MDDYRRHIRIRYGRTFLLQMLLALIQLTSLSLVQAEIRIESLNDSTIYVEQLGPARIYHEPWNIITIFDTNELRKDYEKVEGQLSSLRTRCGNCKEMRELNQLRQIMKNTHKQIQTIQTLEGRDLRHRRGLINAIGSLSKSLFGTLHNDDLENLHKGMDKIYDGQHKLASSISNQTAVIRVLLEEANRGSRTNYDSLIEVLNNNTQQIQMVRALEAMIPITQGLRDDTSTLLTAITMGKHGIIDTQLLTPEILAQVINGVQSQRPGASMLDGRRDYTLLLDIADVAIFLTRGHLVYHLSIPIMEKPIFQLQHLIPIPQRIGKHHIVIIPESEWIAIDETKRSYLQTEQQQL
nr:uncharacterized protein LOC117223082 [Megalopta genalis]